MTIGITFPIKGGFTIKGKQKDGSGDRVLATVPWGFLEPHRPRALKNHGFPLERLYALGGLEAQDLARVILDRDPGTPVSDAETAAALSN